MTFEDWMNELDDYRKYNKRSELIYRETIVDPPNDAVDHWKIIEKWLKTAYICGKIDASKYNMDVIAELQNRLKGQL